MRLRRFGVLMVIALGSCLQLGHASAPDPNGPPTQNGGGQDGEAAALPTVTTQQRTTATGIVLADALNPLSDLGKLLGEKRLSIGTISSLTGGTDPATGKLRLVGATLQATISSPSNNVDVTLPSYRPPTGGGSLLYTPFVARLIAPDLRDLEIDVDLASNKIINVEPGLESTVTSFAPVAGQGALPPRGDENYH